MNRESRLVADPQLSEFGRELLVAGRASEPRLGTEQKLLVGLGVAGAMVAGAAKVGAGTLPTVAKGAVAVGKPALIVQGLAAKWMVACLGGIALVSAVYLAAPLIDETIVVVPGDMPGGPKLSVQPSSVQPSSVQPSSVQPSSASGESGAQLNGFGAPGVPSEPGVAGETDRLELDSARVPRNGESTPLVLGGERRGATHKRRASERGASQRKAAKAVPPRAQAADQEEERTPSKRLSLSSLEARQQLAAELALLDLARARIKAGDPAAARRSLEDYARRFPRGVLSPEAAKLRARLP